MTAEEEMIFRIQQGCAVLGGTKLDVERHQAHAKELMGELARRFPEKAAGTDIQIAEEAMIALVKKSGAQGRRLASHTKYAAAFAPKFAAILRAELNKAD